MSIRVYTTVKERLARLKAIRKSLAELLKKGYSPYPSEDLKDESTIKSSIEWMYKIRGYFVRNLYSRFPVKKNQFIKYLEKNGYDVIAADEFPKKYALNYLNEIILKNSGKSHNNHKVALSFLFDVLERNEMIKDDFIKEIGTKAPRQKKINLIQANN
ncbi:hypothetical protein ODZ84_03725 [Chryseobacterium fluminis]|uniref:hypothetical protein n=1 Tax=Chryseobacterium fluminis TaxID=2983606 RepID=UPI0022543EB9|nr:hypothetical protein [Chryseobacterium sp. MMS21-Ot14]UZT98696.1 hypothetical protein ODZ84_03725 [Chryseobacterium sp. MMS21-Ot14]